LDFLLVEKVSEEILLIECQMYDLYYLEDEELARQLVELGYRGSGEVLKREEFLARKKSSRSKPSTKKKSTTKTSLPK